jgi:hypothetical protein
MMVTNNKDTASSRGIISIYEIAKKCNIPIEAALRIIRSTEEESSKKNNNNDNDNNGDDSKFVIVGDKYLILKSKMKELESTLNGVTKFTDACLLLTSNGIPESCHVDVISKLGYDIIWKGIDYSNVTINKNKKV